VVNGGLSDSDQRPEVSDQLDRNSNNPLLGSPVGSLTQELGQLLAALIVQDQANKGGAPTTAELTSLATLVAAAAARRTIPPASQDGLSTLSHTQPPAAPLHELGDDDELMPIPSTWRQPLAPDDDRWYHQQMCSAVLGLIAGLMIVVPVVLWLSGFFGPQRSETAAARAVPAAADARTASETRSADVKNVRVPVRPSDPARPVEKSPESEAQLVRGNVEQPSLAPVEAKSPPLVPMITAERLVDPNQARIDGLLAQAAQRIEDGDVTGAREMLAGVDDDGQGTVSFALAETYDPNTLAAWGTRGVAADAGKARALYQKAFDLGVARAQNRLDALRP
jgi:hypothetical protein